MDNKAYEYEIFLDSEPGESVQIHGWYPITTEMIRHPEKIDEYIKTGLLRRIPISAPAPAGVVFTRKQVIGFAEYFAKKEYNDNNVRSSEIYLDEYLLISVPAPDSAEALGKLRDKAYPQGYPESAPAVEPWFCVDDSLPTAHTRVLCVDMNYENYKARNKNPFYAEYLRTEKHGDEIEHVFADMFFNRIGVSHWMYKPEAPNLPEDYCEWCYGGKKKSTCQHCHGSGQAPGKGADNGA